MSTNQSKPKHVVIHVYEIPGTLTEEVLRSKLESLRTELNLGGKIQAYFVYGEIIDHIQMEKNNNDQTMH